MHRAASEGTARGSSTGMSPGAVAGRIVLFGPWPPPWGGVAVYMTALSEALHARGADIRLMTYGGDPGPDGRSLVLEGPRWVPSLLGLRRATSWPAVLHDNSAILMHPDKRISPAFSWLMRGVPKVITVHDTSLPQRYSAFSDYHRRQLPLWLGRYGAILATDENLRDFLVGELGIDSTRVRVASGLLPIAPTAEAHLPTAVTEWMRPANPMVLTTGALIPDYDIMTVVEGFRRVRKGMPDARLLIVVNGFASDSTYETQTLERVSDLGDAAMVLRDVPHDVFLALLKKANLFVRGLNGPESFGLSRAEALMVGTPMVATRTAEQANTVVYEYGSPESLDAALGTALRASCLVDHAARQRYVALAETNLDAVIQAYLQVLS